MQRSQSSARLTELDALRGIAACVVVLFHYTWRAPLEMPSIETIPWGIAWGQYGVELFFAISGFVIFMTLERTRTTADFLVSRFARLFPAYWAGIILTSSLVVLLGATPLIPKLETVVVNFTMLQGFLYLPSVDGVYWSLTVELAFYVCMWLLWRFRLLDRIELLLLGWIALKVVWWLLPELPSRLSLLLCMRYIPYFAIGIVAYRVRAGSRRWRDQMPVLIAGFAAVALCDKPAALAVYVIAAAIMWLMVENRLGMLQHRVLVWLGGLSYPIYLIHQNIGYAVIARLEQHGVSPWPALALAIAAVMVLAQLIHTAIETPALSAIRGWWRQRRVAVAA